MGKVILLGGPFDRQEVNLRKEPKYIDVAGIWYEMIFDPETDEPLGAYVVTTIRREDA